MVFRSLTLGLALLGFSTFGSASFAEVAELNSPCRIIEKSSAVKNSLRSSYPPSEIIGFLGRVKQECEIQLAHEKNVSNALSLGIDLNSISAYQALRYIKQSDYLSAIKNQIPVPLIYQLTRANLRSLETRTDEVWINWMTGIKQLDTYVEKIEQGLKLTIDDLRAIHIGFYQESPEVGDFSHYPHPGIFVTAEPYHTGWPWWSVKPSQAAATEAKILTVNREMRKMGLLPPIDELDPKGRPYSSLLFFFKRKVWSSDTRYTTRHYTKLLEFMHESLNFNRRLYTEKPRHNFPLLSPMQVAALVQKWFVGIHGFHEGNGRLSRFLQDLISQAFGMPWAKSGALMDDDVLTTLDEYYALFIKGTREIVGVANACLTQEYPSIAPDLSPENSKKLSYRCWVLD